MRALLILMAAAFLVFPHPAGASIAVQYQGNSFYGVGGSANQLLADVLVGPSNVTIDSFGVYGKAAQDGNLEFLIFDLGNRGAPAYLSSAQSVTHTSTGHWYDASPLSFTLLGGHSYAMGVIADHAFNLGDAYFTGLQQVSGGGLTLLSKDSMVASGVVSHAFAASPSLYGSGYDDSRFQMSLRISTTDCPPAPTPEPATLVLTGLGLAGAACLRRRTTTA